MPGGKKGLSAHALKMIAIAVMVVDHTAWAFASGSFLNIIMHVIGRLTAPIMCYFIAEGYFRTRNVRKYAWRLALFAFISHIPFQYFESAGSLFQPGRGLKLVPTSVIYPLFLGLVSLIVWNSARLQKSKKIVLVTLLCLAACIGDWAFFAVLWTFFFALYRGNFPKQATAFALIGLFNPVLTGVVMAVSGMGPWYEGLYQAGVLLALPFLAMYNGDLRGSKNLKWLFYVFYPVHLVVLGFVKYIYYYRPF